MLANKIRVLSNSLFRGVNIRVKGVPMIGEATLQNLNVREVNL